jgi:hypothetical protein
MSLPPLPESLAVFTPTERITVRLNWIVQEYGELCRKQALEEAEEHFRRKHELCKNRHNYWHCAAIEIRKLLTLP